MGDFFELVQSSGSSLRPPPISQMRSYGIEARLQEAVDPGPEPSTKVPSLASRAAGVGMDFLPALSTVDPPLCLNRAMKNKKWLFAFNLFS